MTSNVGSDLILDGKKDDVQKELHNYFRPEFLNRIDEIIMFDVLSKKSISEIFDKIIDELEDRLKDINIKFEITDNAKEEIINNGYDINFGARPLKRYISKIIETKVSKMIIGSEVNYGDIIIIDFDKNTANYNFKVKKM